jgi:pantoate--beta-alanine ligase
MVLFKRADAITDYIRKQKEAGREIGFVPTMGALHSGHVALLQQAKKETGFAVCSIFVNPTQFNNPDDFRNYPVTVEKDIEVLVQNRCDALFLPPQDEIYPAFYQPRQYELGTLETMLEGRYRPGHFQGVCQVVDRLLGIVSPTTLFLGQKDYQQCQVIQRLLRLTSRTDVSLRIAPTVREENGLALSSRNLRLNEDQRKTAPALYEALRFSKERFGNTPVSEIKSEAIRFLTQKGFKVDYFEIADVATLAPAANASQPTIALVAAYLGNIRLIDNLLLN